LGLTEEKVKRAVGSFKRLPIDSLIPTIFWRYSFVKILLTCKEGYEKVLAREVVACGFKPQADGKGWVQVEGDDPAALHQDGGLCFACDILLTPQNIHAASVTVSRGRLQTCLSHAWSINNVLGRGDAVFLRLAMRSLADMSTR
jgi:hypothetical protein